jgi:hypothetical protein
MPTNTTTHCIDCGKRTTSCRFTWRDKRDKLLKTSHGLCRSCRTMRSQVKAIAQPEGKEN